jgi:hypothetical protein
MAHPGGQAKRQKTLTGLSTAVLETITMRDDDLTAWCGPIAKLPADRFAAALLMALALREQFSQERLSSFAKRPSRERLGALQAAQD